MVEFPLPKLQSDTVHVRFLASPINPADVNQVQGAYPIKPAFEDLGPVKAAVGGNEGVAEVIAAGDAVQDLKVGDRVVMAKTGYGTWRSHAAGPAQDFQLLPRNDKVSVIQQATLTVNPCTAYRMLKDFVKPEQGNRERDALCPLPTLSFFFFLFLDTVIGNYIIQNGANSAVGQAVIQIAKAWGLKSINVVRNR